MRPKQLKLLRLLRQHRAHLCLRAQRLQQAGVVVEAAERVRPAARSLTT